MRHPLIFIFWTGIVLGCYAQTCTQKLILAERAYEAGRLGGILTSLQGCLGEGQFNKEELIRVYKLFTLVNIFSDNEQAADQSLIDLLKSDKEHPIDERTDPAEFIFLYNQFQTKPIFRVGIRGGANLSLPNPTEDIYSTGNVLGKVDNKYYNGRGVASGDSLVLQGALGIGFWTEITFEQSFKHGFDLISGLQFRTSRYDVDNIFIDRTFKSFVRNEQTFGKIPLFIRYTYNRKKGPAIKKKSYIYLILGLSFDYLITAKYRQANRTGGTPYTLPDNEMINLKSEKMVKSNNISMLAGIGLKIPFRTDFFTFEARYEKGFLNYINAWNRYTNQTALMDIGHVEDNLTLDFITVGIGYIHSIYNPKRKTRKK